MRNGGYYEGGNKTKQNLLIFDFLDELCFMIRFCFVFCFQFSVLFCFFSRGGVVEVEEKARTGTGTEQNRTKTKTKQNCYTYLYGTVIIICAVEVRSAVCGLEVNGNYSNCVV